MGPGSAEQRDRTMLRIAGRTLHRVRDTRCHLKKIARVGAADILIQLSNSERVCVRVLAARCARALRRLPPSKRKRAQGKPGARCTRGLVCKNAQKNAHEHTGSAEAIRPSLRDGFNGLSRALPGDRAFLPPSPCASSRKT